MFDGRRAEEVLDGLAAACAAADTALRTAALAAADAIECDAFRVGSALRAHEWLRAGTESSSDDARHLLSLGRLLARHRATREAVESGHLPIRRAAVLARAVTDARRTHYEEAEAVLLQQVPTLHRVDDVERLVAHWCALVDQDVAAPGRTPAQHVVVQHRLDGGADLSASLDAPTTAAVLDGLRASTPAPIRSPVRSRPGG